VKGRDDFHDSLWMMIQNHRNDDFGLFNNVKPNLDNYVSWGQQAPIASSFSSVARSACTLLCSAKRVNPDETPDCKITSTPILKYILQISTLQQSFK